MIGVLLGAFFADHLHHSQPSTDTDIIFPIKVFADSGDIVSITGRLAGKGLANRNNVETVSCYRQFSECQMEGIEQIGPNQLSSLSPSTSLPITHWDDDVITASDKNVSDPGSCFHTTINIARKREFLLYIQEPTNQSSLACQHVDNTIYKWTIERSLWEERAFPKP